jgi:hypothetical protein
VAEPESEEQQGAHRGQEEGSTGASAHNHACDTQDHSKDSESLPPKALPRRGVTRRTGSEHAASLCLLAGVRQGCVAASQKRSARFPSRCCFSLNAAAQCLASRWDEAVALSFEPLLEQLAVSSCCARLLGVADAKHASGNARLGMCLIHDDRCRGYGWLPWHRGKLEHNRMRARRQVL